MGFKSFFALSKEKIYITVGFFLVSFSFSYLNKLHVGSKWPFVVDMFFVAVNFVIILPKKLIGATPSLGFLVKFTPLIFLILILYWYFFACVLVFAYESLNRQDVDQKRKKSESEKKEDVEGIEEEKEKGDEKAEEVQNTLRSSFE